MSNNVLLAVGSDEMALLIPIIAIVGGLLVAIISVISNAIKSSSNTRQREETKRELAAYVAEGSMKPEDAEKILKSDNGRKRD